MQLLRIYQGEYLFYKYTIYHCSCSFREAIGMKVVTALKRNDFGVTHAAIDMICALMHPMHDDYDLRQEQLNKSSLLQSKSFLESLLNMWTTHIAQNTGALIVSAMLDFLTFALCVPYSETTDGKQFDTLLEMVSDRGRMLFRLFQVLTLSCFLHFLLHCFCNSILQWPL